jgi:EamA domain-containing membrane protein RarD
LQFVIGWKFHGEPMISSRLLAFALIWWAIGIYAFDAGMRERHKHGKR